MTRADLNNRIEAIATEAVKAATNEAAYYEIMPTIQDFKNELELCLMAEDCENESTRQMLATLTELKARKLYPQFFQLVQPKQYMDANGNYTADSSKWV